MNFSKSFRLFFLIFAVVFSFIPLSAQNIADMLDEEELDNGFQPYLKIGIKVDISSIAIEGDAEILDKNGKVISSIQGSHKITVSQGKISVSGKTFNSETIKFHPDLIPLKVDGRMFRGDIDIWVQNGKLTVVNELFIEDYVKGVINKEAIPSWPIEAKKTQAVLARTFAVYQKMFNPRSKLFDLAPSVLDQVYDGLSKEDVSSVQAVNDTRGEVITVGSNPAKIYFHSTCGGTVSSSAEIWKKEESHLQQLECPYCKNSSLYRWTRKIKSEDLAKKLSSAGIRSVRSVSVQRGKTRVENVIVNGQKIPVNKFRELVGFSVIWSNDFSVSKNGGTWVFNGKGAGHGVGVCQWGMAGMAKQGKSHYEILNFYLKGIEIRKMY